MEEICDRCVQVIAQRNDARLRYLSRDNDKRSEQADHFLGLWTHVIKGRTGFWPSQFTREAIQRGLPYEAANE